MSNIIKTILAEWKGKNIPLVIPREIELQSYLNMKVNKILVLNGFRRVGKTYILYGLVDELHNIPNWSKWLRRVYDNHQNMRIFVSGSSSRMSEEEIPTELRGRFLEVKVLPLSFKEFLKFKKLNFDFKLLEYSEKEKPMILKALTEYLTYGGLPEIVLENVDKKFELAQSYYATVIKRDIVERYSIKNEGSLKRSE